MGATGKRFALARVLGCAMLVGPATERVLPVTRARTYLQRVERAFASELLCPWAELEGVVAERGAEQEVIEEVAERFEVSPLQITSTLVNKRVLPREAMG